VEAGKPSASRDLFAKWLRQGERALSLDEIRATMSTTTGNQGGFSVQSDVAAQLIDALKGYLGVRQVADVLVTNEGRPLSFPGSDGTAEVGELIGENTTATAADPVFTSVSLNTFKYSSKIVAVPYELLQDSSIDVEAFVRKRLVDRLGRIQNQHFTTGTGSGQPNGVATAAASGKVGTTGQTTTIIFDDLVDLIASVNYAYRGPQCSFMTSDANLAKIRKLKDTAGRPIFIPGWDGLGRAMPDTLLGYNVVVNDDIAAMAANAKSVLFGDFSYYKVRDAMDITMFRFDDSAYAKLGQVGFLAWMRSGANLVDTLAVKAYVNSAT
jgi:HK97 family phage major capsid protein